MPRHMDLYTKHKRIFHFTFYLLLQNIRMAQAVKRLYQKYRFSKNHHRL